MTMVLPEVLSSSFLEILNNNKGIAISVVVALLSLPFVGKVVDRLYHAIRLEFLLYQSKKKKKRSIIGGDDDDDDAAVDNVVGVVSSIFVHPVKSMRAISLDESKLDGKGLVDDRRFMVVYELPLPAWKKPGETWSDFETSHRFLTQRQCPSLATIVATMTTNDNNNKRGRTNDEVLILSCMTPKKTTVVIPLSNESPTSTQVYRAGIWEDTVLVQDMGDEAAEFLRQVVDNDEECTISTTSVGTKASSSSSSSSLSSIRLVRHNVPDRAVDTTYLPNLARTWSGSSPLVSLTDGFPILIANEVSLDDLNNRLKANGKDLIPMTRFRPNLVIGPTITTTKQKKNNKTTLRAFEEDRWKVIAVGDVLFAIVKACPRCKQSCTDQQTGVVNTEPLDTMKSFRQLGDQENSEDVFFAQNAVPIFRLGQRRNGCKIRVGDPVRVIEWGDPIFR
jgi:uncharacterized protein